MANFLKKLTPTFVPIAFGIFDRLRRDWNHNGNIRKNDKNTEKLSTLEHLMVRLEKKIQFNRETFEKALRGVHIWLLLNSALLVAILVKLFFFN